MTASRRRTQAEEHIGQILESTGDAIATADAELHSTQAVIDTLTGRAATLRA